MERSGSNPTRIEFRATACHANLRDNHALAAGSKDCLALPHPVVWHRAIPKEQ
jgi:hypothetical protein